MTVTQLSNSGSCPVNPDSLRRWVSDGRGFPVEQYFDPQIFDFELRSMFYDQWVFFAPLSLLSEPGSVVVGNVGLTPIFLVRTQDGELKGFLNACRHRGYKLFSEDVENCKKVYCKYHAWAYNLDGKLTHAPHRSGLDFEELSLLPISIGTWGPAVFVNTDPNALPLETAMPELFQVTKERSFEEDPAYYSYVGKFEDAPRANWKLWIDNGVECYHCGPVHGRTFAQAFQAEVSEEGQDTKRFGKILYGEVKPKPSRSSEQLSASWFRNIHIFPGSFITQHEDFMCMARMNPTGPESCEFVAYYFSEPGVSPERAQAWADLYRKTFTEDAEIVAGQQVNMRSHGILPFTYNPLSESVCIRSNEMVLDAYDDYLKA